MPLGYGHDKYIMRDNALIESQPTASLRLSSVAATGFAPSLLSSRPAPFQFNDKHFPVAVNIGENQA